MVLFRHFLARARRLRGPKLDSIIPPEIKNDRFYTAIARIASTPGLRHILEIGASGGAGSTEALVKGTLANPDRPMLHCIEVSAVRYNALVKRYEEMSFVHCYRASSVPLEAFAPVADIERFYRTVDSKLRSFPLKQILAWREQDVEYVLSHRVPDAGIRSIKHQHGIASFDAVLIDGSEFTATAELHEVYGARFLLLDDICTYKNYANFHVLSTDPAYRLLEARDAPRNGYAVFERRSAEPGAGPVRDA